MSKIDWKYLMSLPKLTRQFEMKRIAKEMLKEKNEAKGTNSRLGDRKNK